MKFKHKCIQVCLKKCKINIQVLSLKSIWNLVNDYSVKTISNQIQAFDLALECYYLKIYFEDFWVSFLSIYQKDILWGTLSEPKSTLRWQRRLQREWENIGIKSTKMKEQNGKTSLLEKDEGGAGSWQMKDDVSRHI